MRKSILFITSLVNLFRFSFGFVIRASDISIKVEPHFFIKLSFTKFGPVSTYY